MTSHDAPRYTIRSATEIDVPQILDIYRYYVANTTIALMLYEPNKDYIASRLRSTIERKLPYIVAAAGADKDGSPEHVLGYCHVSPFSPDKSGYRHSVELTLYLQPDYLSVGIGSALLSAVLEQLRSAPYVSWESGQEDKTEKKSQIQVRKVYAIMSTDVAGRGGWIAKGEKTKEWYVKKFGFKEAGRLNGVGEKFEVR